mmetsp:Transcript_20354/g.25122  ORF Transcript_20354/g.25122 Transcript_20354/m.25122 type:complete len:256 (+) Transcript_20354:179-946(+)
MFFEFQADRRFRSTNNEGVFMTRNPASTNRCFHTPEPLVGFLKSSSPKMEKTVSLNLTLICLSSMMSLSACSATRRGPNSTAFTKRTSSKNVCVTSPTKGPIFPLELPSALQYCKSQTPVSSARLGSARQLASKAAAADSTFSWISELAPTPFLGASSQAVIKAFLLSTVCCWSGCPREASHSKGAKTLIAVRRSAKSVGSRPSSSSVATPPKPPSLQPPRSVSGPSHVEGIEVRPVRRPSSARTAYPSGSKSHS